MEEIANLGYPPETPSQTVPQDTMTDDQLKDLLAELISSSASLNVRGLARRSLHRHRECGHAPRVDERPRSLLQGRRKGGRPEQSRRGSIQERLIMETRRWKAFLRMNGETTDDTSQDILTEFKAMVEYLKWIGVDYSMVVQVEAGQTERSQSLALEQTPRRRGSRQLGD